MPESPVNRGVDLTIEPACRAWAVRAVGPRDGTLRGTPLAAWRRSARRELALDLERPIIATGHQTLLWHPGILVKYLLTGAVAREAGLATANLVVDQHAGGFGAYPVPVRRRDGSVTVRGVELTRVRPHVPMALHGAFAPSAPPSDLRSALPAVAAGVASIHEAVAAHAGADSAAEQMARALDELMAPWVEPMRHVSAAALVRTSLGRAFLEAMVEDPQRCAEAYNEAVRGRPEAGIGPLLVRDDYVELPLWRIRPDGRRMYAYDADVERWLDGDDTLILMPRALLMTALLRTGVCDLFVHGLGGANYDRAMERWLEGWLGIHPAPIAVASATLRLPLLPAGDDPVDVTAATASARRAWHDPEPAEDGAPGPAKRELLEAIDHAPRGSAARRAAFFSLHRELASLRSMHVGRVERLQRRAEEARQHAADAEVAARRDWPFPLYPPEMIDALHEAVRERVTAPPIAEDATDGRRTEGGCGSPIAEAT